MLDACVALNYLDHLKAEAETMK